jgi:hypothetical protein
MCRSIRLLVGGRARAGVHRTGATPRGPARRSGAVFCAGITSACRQVWARAEHGRAAFSRRVVPQPMSTRRNATAGCTRHRRHGVIATPMGPEPTAMSVGFLVLVFTSIVDTVPLPCVGDEGGLAVRRDCHAARVRGDYVGGVLGPGLHVNRRHRVTAGVGDMGRGTALLARRYRRHSVRDHTHERARHAEHQHPKTPPEPRHRCRLAPHQPLVGPRRWRARTLGTFSLAEKVGQVHTGVHHRDSRGLRTQRRVARRCA